MTEPHKKEHTPRARNRSRSAPRARTQYATTRVRTDQPKTTRTQSRERPAKASTRSKQKDTTKTTEPKVSLPTNMSVRAQEKASVFARFFDAELDRAVYQVSYVTGVCFLLIGSTLALAATFGDHFRVNQFVALAVESNVETVDSETAKSVQAPTFSLLDAVPETTNEPFSLTFTADHVSRVVVKVQVLDGVGYMPDPDIKQVSDTRFKATIPADAYPDGMYVIRFLLESKYGREYNTQYRSGVFSVSAQTSDAGSATVTEVTRQVAEPTDPSNAPRERTGEVFAIFSQDTVLSGTDVVGVAVPEDYAYIELYGTPTSGGETLLFGVASKRFERWQFVINTRQIPNGSYSVYAKTEHNGQLLETDPIQLTVENTDTSTAEAPSRSIERSGSSGSATRVNRTRSAGSAGSESVVNQVDTMPDEDRLEREVSIALQQAEETVEQGFRAYIEAVQAGDAAAIQQQQNALRQQAEALASRNAILSSDDVLQRIEDSLERIDRFEAYRSQKRDDTPAPTATSTDRAMIDTDGDGISDVDERLLYNTDPTRADTDGDGVSDAVELIRGQNPASSEREESQIRYESPQQTIGLNRPDTLRVATVTPIIDLAATEPSDNVKTEIAGTALPNTFVSLYIFSTPTVVTIKTDADGSFVYTFDQELSDGEHEIYVAVTDNTGQILAQSNPFSFVKEAQAFTPVDAAEAEVVSEQVILAESTKGYNVAVGVGILSLGIILLMLGMGLRSRTGDIATASSPSEPDTDTSGTKLTAAQKKPVQSGRHFEHIDAS